MDQIRIWILLGRIAQFLLATALACLSLAVNADVDYNSNAGMITAGAFGVCIAVFAVVGLFELRSFSNKRSHGKTFWIIFTLDCLAIPLGVAASTTVLLCANGSGWYPEATFAVTVVCGYLCSILLVAFVVRSVRNWRSQPRFPAQDHLHEPEKQLCARCHAEIHGMPGYYHMEPVSAGYPVQDEKASSPRASSPRSFDTTARWSGVSGAATLAYPNIAAMTGPPTRATSQKAPSYTSR